VTFVRCLKPQLLGKFLVCRRGSLCFQRISLFTLFLRLSFLIGTNTQIALYALFNKDTQEFLFSNFFSSNGAANLAAQLFQSLFQNLLKSTLHTRVIENYVAQR